MCWPDGGPAERSARGLFPGPRLQRAAAACDRGAGPTAVPQRRHARHEYHYEEARAPAHERGQDVQRQRGERGGGERHCEGRRGGLRVRFERRAHRHVLLAQLYGARQQVRPNRYQEGM